MKSFNAFLVAFLTVWSFSATAQGAGECSRQADCPDEQLCINNTCQSPESPSETCDTDEDCTEYASSSSDGGETVGLLTDYYQPAPSLEWLGWTLVGVSGAFLTSTIVSWVWIDSIENDSKFTDYSRRVGEYNPTVEDVCAEADQGFLYASPNTTEADDFEDVRSMCNRADVLEVLQWVFLGSAVAAGGVGAYVLITEREKEREVAGSAPPTFVLQPRISLRASTVTATLRF